MLTGELLLQLAWQHYGVHRGCYRRHCTRCGKQFFASRPEAKYTVGAPAGNVYIEGDTGCPRR